MKNKKEEIKAPDMPKRILTFHDDESRYSKCSAGIVELINKRDFNPQT